MDTPAQFAWLTCQRGAEPALKAELARLWPQWRFAYSRPGFLTYKLPPGLPVADDFVLGSVFARATGLSLGKTMAGDLAERAAQAVPLWSGQSVDVLHVFPRDAARTTQRGFTPGRSAEDADAERALLEAWPVGSRPRTGVAQPGDLVADVVRVADDQWWCGYHRAVDWASCQPGGLDSQQPPPGAVSRAYTKMTEALAWSGLPIVADQRAAELGCAPGGAAQALLDRGVFVLGVDPAEVSPVVANHARFTHLRRRGSEVRRREFRKIRWLISDMNVAPQFTLDTVDAIVNFPETNVRGLLLTLKLLEWNLAEHLPAYVQRVRGWGYTQVRVRQLTHNRQEVCLAASGRPNRR